MKTTSWGCAILCLVLAGPAVLAEVGGGRLMSRELTPKTRPDDAVATVQADKLVFESDRDKIKALQAIVNLSVQKAERAVRAAPPANASSAQRDELRDSKAKKLKEIVEQAAGTSVIATVTVVDVAETAKMHGATDGSGLGKYTVVGRVEWLSDPVLTDDEKKRVATINTETDNKLAADRKRLQELNRKYDSYLIESTQKRMESTERKRDESIKDIRVEAGKRRPVHVVYLLTDDAGVLAWKRGETRSARGVLQSFGTFVYAPWEARFQTKKGDRAGSRSSEAILTREGNVELTTDKAEGLYVGTEGVVKVFQLTAGTSELSGASRAAVFVATHRVTLKSGRVIEGVATEDGDHVSIKMEMGTVRVEKGEVKSTETIPGTGAGAGEKGSAPAKG